ncbi:hypothetical protein [Muricoccus radiodurans]|uniref:hypothetical protein n=1 Tax=Muricoccus radiodurans TaxID=2231721 RepID=UPI003CEEB89D
MTEVRPLRTGRGVLRLALIEALQPSGPRRHIQHLTIVHHAPDHLVGTFNDVYSAPSTALITAISERWLQEFRPDWWQRFPAHAFAAEDPAVLTDPQRYLHAAFADPACWTGRVKAADFGPPGRPMQAAITLPMDRLFTPLEANLLRAGFLPEVMEDRWFAYMLDDRLHLRRSWTGELIYVVELVAEGRALRARSVAVNADNKAYHMAPEAEERDRLNRLISGLLLCRWPSADA